MNKEDPAIHSEVETLRHSCAHVMAHAIQKIWPNAKFGIGPTIESGFYYDIDIDTKLSPEDLPRIEAEMFKLINANQGFVRKEHSLDEAIEIFRKLGQTYKIELIEDLRKVGVQSVSTYGEGDFLDLCRGPHLQKTGQIKAFKLTSVAGAYWRGSEKNPQLQRIYGTAYPSKAELHEHMRLIEEAKKRDHRKLGKELDLFSFHPEAPASPFFHPKGTVVYNRLVQLMRDLYRPYQYDEIITPQIMDISLWKKSGHYDNYREDMFFTESEERQFAIKPMNCPAATFVYSSHKRSYRDLPLRLADFGRVHRNEKSGVTAGLTRVRTFCQDDAHIFCTPEQIETEIKKVIEMSMKIYKLFDFTDIRIALSTRPEKRVGGDELWDQAEVALKKVLDNTGHAYEVNPGDGAFYGPKIDFRVKDALKREHQLSTIQLDFNLPERFDLTYVGTDNSSNRPVMVHRAVLGSIERFMGVLVEHVAGAFPWLAPLQARIVPIGDGHTEYCKGLMTELQELGYRVDLDARNESMGLKTRESQTAKIPFMAVAGDREMQDGQFAIRKYGERESKVLGRAELLAFFKELNEVPHQLTRS